MRKNKWKNILVIKIIECYIMIAFLKHLQIAYMQYLHMTILWYMVLAAIMAGFVVAFVAMYGWEKLSELWKRFGKNVD